MNYQVEAIESYSLEFKYRIDQIFNDYREYPLKCHGELSLAFLRFEKNIKKMYNIDYETLLQKTDYSVESSSYLLEVKYILRSCCNNISSLLYSNLLHRLDLNIPINKILQSILISNDEETTRLKVAEYCLGKEIQPCEFWKCIFEIIAFNHYSDLHVPVTQNDTMNSAPLKWIQINEIKNLVISEVYLVNMTNRSIVRNGIQYSSKLETVLMEFFALPIYLNSRINPKEIQPFIRYLSDVNYKGVATCPDSIFEFIHEYKHAFLFYLGCLSGVKQGTKESLIPVGYRTEFLRKLSKAFAKIKDLSFSNMEYNMKNVSMDTKFVVTSRTYKFPIGIIDIENEVNRYFYKEAKNKLININS